MTSRFRSAEGDDEFGGQIDGLLVFDQQAQAFREPHDQAWTHVARKFNFGELDALTREAPGRLASWRVIIRHAPNLPVRGTRAHEANFKTLTVRREPGPDQ